MAHCPTSNAALGSGMFPLRRHRAAGVRVALGSDVGAGTGFSLLKEGLQAYFGQRLLGVEGEPLTPAHLLHLATAAGADALGLADQVGDLSVGKRFDAVWLRPPPAARWTSSCRPAPVPTTPWPRAFALGTPADVRRSGSTAPASGLIPGAIRYRKAPGPAASVQKGPSGGHPPRPLCRKARGVSRLRR